MPRAQRQRPLFRFVRRPHDQTRMSRTHVPRRRRAPQPHPDARCPDWGAIPQGARVDAARGGPLSMPRLRPLTFEAPFDASSNPAQPAHDFCRPCACPTTSSLFGVMPLGFITGRAARTSSAIDVGVAARPSTITQAAPRRRAQSACLVEDVDSDCIERELTLGKDIGRWAPPFNDCNTVVEDAVERCKTTSGSPLGNAKRAAADAAALRRRETEDAGVP